MHSPNIERKNTEVYIRCIRLKFGCWKGLFFDEELKIVYEQYSFKNPFFESKKQSNGYSTWHFRGVTLNRFGKKPTCCYALIILNRLSLIIFNFSTLYFGDTLHLMYKSSNLFIYIFVANCQFAQIVLLQYALQRWKLALSITWAKYFEAPIFSFVVLIYALSNRNLLPWQTQVKDNNLK